MSVKLDIKGVDKVIKNINNQIKDMKVLSAKALIKSAALIRRDMDKTPPLIPVDTGNLRGSWTANLQGAVSGRNSIKIGFTANYASEVEFTEKKYKRPNSGPLFFTSSLMRNKENVLKIMREEMKR